METDALITEAAAVVNPRLVDDRLFADVGCALVRDRVVPLRDLLPHPSLFTPVDQI